MINKFCHLVKQYAKLE